LFMFSSAGSVDFSALPQREAFVSQESHESFDYRSLAEFFRHGIKEYPAEHYMVVLSGSRNGVGTNAFGQREITGGGLSIPALSNIVDSVARTDAHKFAIFGLDSCQINIAELCYELRRNVEFVVGSEGCKHNSRWPYYNVLAALTKKPATTPREYAHIV